MKKTPLIILFLVSASLCGASFARVSFEEWGLNHHLRNVATVKTKKKPSIVSKEEVIQPKNYKIASAYKRSKSIWGVYDKVKDELVDTKRPKKNIKTMKTNLGELILKDGQVVLISPIPYEGSTQIEVANLPYKKNGKNKYIIDLDKTSLKQKALLTKLYTPLIEGVEGHESAKIDKMSCFKRRGSFSCELNLNIQ